MNSLKSNYWVGRMPKISKNITRIQWLILGILTIIFLAGSLPSYIAGKWSWSHPPQVRNIQSFKQLEKTGLIIPGWEKLEHGVVRIGGHKWIVQSSKIPGHEPIEIFLLPQFYYLDLPMIDWLDLNGVERWSTDSEQVLKFQVGNASSNQVKARFFRAWKDDTDAVVQWYAFPHGGNYAPSRWFWKDQQAQIRNQRVPWVAVSLKIPIAPLSDLKDNQELALSLAKSVQNTLDNQVFKSMLYP